MPALRDRWAGAEAGVQKPPKNEPAGSGEWFAVYGDFVGQRLRRGTIMAVALRAAYCWKLRIGRCRCTRPPDRVQTRDAAPAFAGAGTTGVRRRERNVPRGKCRR